MVMMVVVMPASAKTDIFGDVRQFGVVSGDKLASVQGGFIPIPGSLGWGGVLDFKLDRGATDRTRVNRVDGGLYLDYPIAAAQSLIKPLDVTGKAFAGIAIKTDLERFDALYIDWTLGGDIMIEQSENTTLELRTQYFNRDNASGIGDLFVIGPVWKWKSK
jgi:hypothetical protein